MPITIGMPIYIEDIKFDVLSLLGKGGLSNVYLAVNTDTNEMVAIKDFKYNEFYDSFTHKNDCEEYWENELLNTQSQSKSGFPTMTVLNYEKRLDLKTPEFFIVLKFIEGQTFLDFYHEFILTCRGLANLDLSSMVRYVFIPLAKHLNYCHSQENIVHRDFSVKNIMIQKGDEDYWPILIDWGLSKYVGPDWIAHTPKPFMVDDMPRDIPINQKGAPPEIRNGYFPVAASDIYYFGYLLYFVFTGGISKEISELTNPESFVLKPKEINWYLPDIYDNVVQHLTQYEPADRPKDFGVIIKMLEELIKIREIHFDFDLFMTDPDTDELTGLPLSK